MAHLRRNVALLLLVLVARKARAQLEGLPPQCDPQEVLYPYNMAFMGPVEFIEAGRYQ